MLGEPSRQVCSDVLAIRPGLRPSMTCHVEQTSGSAPQVLHTAEKEGEDPERPAAGRAEGRHLRLLQGPTLAWPCFLLEPEAGLLSCDPFQTLLPRE